MKHFVTGLLALESLALAAATVQGVRLQVSPKGISPDAFLFGGLFGAMCIAVAVLAWRVHQQGRIALLISAAAFALIAALGIVGGVPLLLLAGDATDGYIAPLGGIGARRQHPSRGRGHCVARGETDSHRV